MWSAPVEGYLAGRWREDGGGRAAEAGRREQGGGGERRKRRLWWQVGWSGSEVVRWWREMGGETPAIATPRTPCQARCDRGKQATVMSRRAS